MTKQANIDRLEALNQFTRFFLAVSTIAAIKRLRAVKSDGSVWDDRVRRVALRTAMELLNPM